MPVDDTHREHQKRLPQWSRCRDTIGGSDDVKGRGTKYLPMLGGQKDGEYAAYSERALFFGASSRTLRGFIGAIFRKEPVAKYPERLITDLDQVTVDGLSADEFAKLVCEEVFKTGRYGILIDADSDGKNKYAASYQAEQIINWRTQRINGKEMLTMVVLQETYEEQIDEFSVDVKIQYRVLTLSVAGERKYQQNVYREKQAGGKSAWTAVPELSVTPTMRGIFLGYIPFLFINQSNMLAKTDAPPLIELVDVNLSHYRTSADLEHGAHYTALPTAWVAGFPVDTKLRVGSTTAWVSKEKNARAGFLEFTGQGLDSLRNLKRDKEENMATIGARMLEQPKRVAEATDTHKLRLSGEHATLVTIAATVSNAMTKMLRIIAQWQGIQPAALEDISYVLNNDFSTAKMTPQEMTALMGMWQGGGISQETFLHNLQQGEVLPTDIEIEEEISRIEVQEGSDIESGGNVVPMKKEFEFTKDKNGKVVGTIG